MVAFDWFLHLESAEKILFLNNMLCLISVIVPAAYFNIFDSRYYVNNPVAITSIFIAFLFFVSLFWQWRWIKIARVLGAVYYFLLLLSKVIFHTLTKAETYSLFWGFYLALLAGMIYILISVHAILRGR